MWLSASINQNTHKHYLQQNIFILVFFLDDKTASRLLIMFEYITSFADTGLSVCMDYSDKEFYLKTSTMSRLT